MKKKLLLIISFFSNIILAQTISDKNVLLSEFILNQNLIFGDDNKARYKTLFFLNKPSSVAGSSSISGIISENNLGAVENYTINLIKVENDNYFSVSDTLTDAIGAYNFNNLSEGKYVILTGTKTDEYLDYLWKPANIGGPVLCSGCVKQADSQFDLQIGESKTIDLMVKKGGVISGTVIDVLSSVIPLTSLSMNIYSDGSDYQIQSIEDNVSGTYTFNGVPNGSYKLYITPQINNDNLFNEYVPQIYNGGECVYCIEKVKQGIGENLIISDLGTLSDINFELSKGSRIEGIVVDESTLSSNFLLGIIFVANETGNNITIAGILDSTDGSYTVGGLLPGRYYVHSYIPSYGYFGSPFPSQRMLFANKPCYYNGCDFTTGDVIEIGVNETISNIDFSIKRGGLIKGKITDSLTGNAPIIDNDLFIEVYDADENVVGGARVRPAAQGDYTSTFAIPEGAYSVKIGNTRTGLSSKPYIEEKFNNIPCIGISCDLSTVNVNVITNQRTYNIDFSLDKGFSISGNIIDIALAEGIGNINLILYKSLDNGNNIKYASFTKTSNIELDELGYPTLIGSYQFSGLPEGDYYLVTNNGANLPFVKDDPKIHGKWIDKLYGNVLCPAGTCDISQGNIITVNASNPNVSDININLNEGAIISGKVFDINDQQIEGININLYTNTGANIGQFKTNSIGEYQTTGLLAGTYYLTTSSHPLWRDVKYGDNLCLPQCDPLTGDIIELSIQQQLNNIDFHLTRIDGNVFRNGFE